MKFLKKALKLILGILTIPLIYLLVSLLLTLITVNKNNTNLKMEKTIYLNTNGIHLDIIIPVSAVDNNLISGLKIKDEKYLSFGWGDKNFYLNTPKWSDLTLKNTISALFLNSSTLIHLTKYSVKNPKWTVVNLSEKQLAELNKYILKSFKLDEAGNKMILENKGYFFNDDFYKATGSYSCIKTCNSWVNSAFKMSGLKSCYWTPFDFGVINKYKN